MLGNRYAGDPGAAKMMFSTELSLIKYTKETVVLNSRVNRNIPLVNERSVKKNRGKPPC